MRLPALVCVLAISIATLTPSVVGIDPCVDADADDGVSSWDCDFHRTYAKHGTFEWYISIATGTVFNSSLSLVMGAVDLALAGLVWLWTLFSMAPPIIWGWFLVSAEWCMRAIPATWMWWYPTVWAQVVVAAWEVFALWGILAGIVYVLLWALLGALVCSLLSVILTLGVAVVFLAVAALVLLASVLFVVVGVLLIALALIVGIVMVGLGILVNAACLMIIMLLSIFAFGYAWLVAIMLPLAVLSVLLLQVIFLLVTRLESWDLQKEPDTKEKGKFGFVQSWWSWLRNRRGTADKFAGAEEQPAQQLVDKLEEDSARESAVEGLVAKPAAVEETVAEPEKEEEEQSDTSTRLTLEQTKPASQAQEGDARMKTVKAGKPTWKESACTVLANGTGLLATGIVRYFFFVLDVRLVALAYEVVEELCGVAIFPNMDEDSALSAAAVSIHPSLGWTIDAIGKVFRFFGFFILWLNESLEFMCPGAASIFAVSQMAMGVLVMRLMSRPKIKAWLLTLLAVAGPRDARTLSRVLAGIGRQCMLKAIEAVITGPALVLLVFPNRQAVCNYEGDLITSVAAYLALLICGLSYVFALPALAWQTDLMSEFMQLRDWWKLRPPETFLGQSDLAPPEWSGLGRKVAWKALQGHLGLASALFGYITEDTAVRIDETKMETLNCMNEAVQMSSRAQYEYIKLSIDLASLRFHILPFGNILGKCMIATNEGFVWSAYHGHMMLQEKCGVRGIWPKLVKTIGYAKAALFLSCPVLPKTGKICVILLAIPMVIITLLCEQAGCTKCCEQRYEPFHDSVKDGEAGSDDKAENEPVFTNNEPTHQEVCFEATRQRWIDYATDDDIKERLACVKAIRNKSLGFQALSLLVEVGLEVTGLDENLKQDAMERALRCSRAREVFAAKRCACIANLAQHMPDSSKRDGALGEALASSMCGMPHTGPAVEQAAPYVNSAREESNDASARMHGKGHAARRVGHRPKAPLKVGRANETRPGDPKPDCIGKESGGVEEVDQGGGGGTQQQPVATTAEVDRSGGDGAQEQFGGVSMETTCDGASTGQQSAPSRPGRGSRAAKQRLRSEGVPGGPHDEKVDPSGGQQSAPSRPGRGSRAVRQRSRSERVPGGPHDEKVDPSGGQQSAPSRPGRGSRAVRQRSRSERVPGGPHDEKVDPSGGQPTSQRSRMARLVGSGRRGSRSKRPSGGLSGAVHPREDEEGFSLEDGTKRRGRKSRSSRKPRTEQGDGSSVTADQLCENKAGRRRQRVSRNGPQQAGIAEGTDDKAMDVVRSCADAGNGNSDGALGSEDPPEESTQEETKTRNSTNIWEHLWEANDSEGNGASECMEAGMSETMDAKCQKAEEGMDTADGSIPV